MCTVTFFFLAKSLLHFFSIAMLCSTNISCAFHSCAILSQCRSGYIPVLSLFCNVTALVTYLCSHCSMMQVLMVEWNAEVLQHAI